MGRSLPTARVAMGNLSELGAVGYGFNVPSFQLSLGPDEQWLLEEENRWVLDRLPLS